MAPPHRMAVLVVAALGCGRVSFIGDGAVGDAGVTPSSTTSSSSSSSSSGGGSSSGPSCGGSRPDAGAPDCGTPAEPACPRPSLEGPWGTAWTKLSQDCTGCHGPDGFVPQARCFPLDTPSQSHPLWCSYARQDDATLVAGAYAQSRLARALHAENRRYLCSTRTTEHAPFLGAAEPDFQAWYDALFTSP